MTDQTCPNCGDALPANMRAIVMQTCASCGTTLFLEGDRLRNGGEAGEMHDGPMLFGIGDRVHLGKAQVDVLGHARFSYGRGWWDEFWCEDEDRRGCWVSVDEGDVVLQYPLKPELYPKLSGTPSVGQPFMAMGADYVIKEVDTAECIALRGAFGEALERGETYRFFNASSYDGALLSGEFWDGGQSWFVGYWHDPFEIRVEKAAA